jgi:hypothetical protein
VSSSWLDGEREDDDPSCCRVRRHNGARGSGELERRGAGEDNGGRGEDRRFSRVMMGPRLPHGSGSAPLLHQPVGRPDLGAAAGPELYPPPRAPRRSRAGAWAVSIRAQGRGACCRGGRIRRRRRVLLRAPLTLLFGPTPRATAAAPLCLAFFASGWVGGVGRERDK